MLSHHHHYLEWTSAMASVKIIGVTITNSLSIAEYVHTTISSCVQTLYMLSEYCVAMEWTTPRCRLFSFISSPPSCSMHQVRSGIHFSWLQICRTTNLELYTKWHQTCSLCLLVQIQIQKLTSLLQLVNNWPPSELPAPMIRHHTRFYALQMFNITLYYGRRATSSIIYWCIHSS